MFSDDCLCKEKVLQIDLNVYAITERVHWAECVCVCVACQSRCSDVVMQRKSQCIKWRRRTYYTGDYAEPASAMRWRLNGKLCQWAQVIFEIKTVLCVRVYSKRQIAHERRRRADIDGTHTTTKHCVGWTVNTVPNTILYTILVVDLRQCCGTIGFALISKTCV